MAEDNDGGEAGAAPDTSGLAIDLAMEEARGNPALSRHAAAFLTDQRGLIADQRHHMRIQLRQLHLGIAEKWLGVLLRVATAFTGLAIAAGLAYLIWNAAASNDLVIDSFQVPPELAARGLSGPVVAAKLSDKIATMQAQTTSQRAPKSYANGISDGLKLDIPETGVSLAELDRFLRAKLGHDLHIGGEMVQQDRGAIALTARVGADSATVTGTEAEMDGLLQKLAEEIYHTTQPYRFSVWLQAHGRVPEGVAILKAIATAGGPAKERAWAYNGWAVATTQGQSEKAGMALTRRGRELDPDSYLLAQNLAVTEMRLGHEEESQRLFQAALAALTAHGKDYTQPERIAPLVHNYTASIFVHRGALLEAAKQQRLFIDSGISNAPTFSPLAEILSALHQPAAAAAALAQNVPGANIANLGTFRTGGLHAQLLIALEAQDWAAVLAGERDFTAMTAQYPGFAEDKPTMFEPSWALALAHGGQFAAADARLKSTPGDCYPCLRARAQVAALAGQNARADWWFARAAAIAPTSPYAQAEWGRALLDRKQPDAAIAHFQLASKIGPHFADPIEGWGEALMARNQSHLALAKFAAAEKYAPNWGRLQLKWGEALVYAGKPADAKAHFARAAALDLTPAEKSELAKVNPHG